MKIVVDIYGADEGAEVVVKGVARALSDGLDFFPVLVGEEGLVKALMQEAGISADRYEVVHTTEFVTQNDPPTVVFGGSEDYSMVKAYSRLKKDDECVALLSAGNTGALLVGSICRLGLVKGLKFPLLSSALPGSGDKLLILVDCGANVECTADDLARFAVMGNVFSKTYCGIEEPRIGLMSVGREEGKGNALIKEAYAKIAELPLNFVGNLEGSDIVSGYADVIVSDGFSGNLLLKCAEAVGKAAMDIAEKIGGEANREFADAVKAELFRRFDFNSQGAATFLGTKKTVVKMHGSANEDTVAASIKQIIRLENAEFSKAIAEAMEK